VRFRRIFLDMQDSLPAAVWIKVAGMGDSTHLSTWVDRETKRRFAAIANHEGASESALLRRMVDLMVQSATAVATLNRQDRSPRDTRVSVRLRPDDQQLLKERAAARDMPAATYVSVLVRAHLRSLTPVPKDELLALRRAVSELSAIGRNLNQIARVANQGGKPSAPQQEDLRTILRLCVGLRDHVKDLLKANLRSWEAGYAEKHD
jgi:predicted DNA binding CopG/RHH family protein